MNGQDKIRKLAYKLYLKRRNAGSQLSDWLKAENKIKRNERLVHIIKGLVALATILGVLVSIWQGISANNRTDLNTELSNKPFVSIENPYWWRIEDTDWFSSMFTTCNYGNKPAEKVTIRNFRAIVFRIDNKKILEKAKITKGDGPYLQEYFKDEKNKFYLELMERLTDYFKRKPDADKIATSNFLASLLKEGEGASLFSYNGGLFFSPTEINNDMDDYYKKHSKLIFPGQPELRGLIEQIGGGGVSDVLAGDSLLVVYWAIKYRGFRQDKEYTTFYMGFCDKDILEKVKSNFIDSEGKVCHKLQEFSSWTKDEIINQSKL